MHSIFEILEAPTDSAGPDLISLDDLKLALGIAETDTSEDATLQAVITFQSRIIAEYCNRRFGLVEAMETFRLDRGEVLLARQALTLWQYPVVEVHEVSLAGATGDGYEFDPAERAAVVGRRLLVRRDHRHLFGRLRSAGRRTGPAAAGGDRGGERRARADRIRRQHARSQHPRGAARRHPHQLFHAGARHLVGIVGLPVGAGDRSAGSVPADVHCLRPSSGRCRGHGHKQTVFIVAGGASVLEHDLEALRGRRVIVINSSVHAVPFADYLYFGD